MNCIDMYYVEFFNNVFFVYYDKRIKFGDEEYKWRLNMVVLDWNENVDWEYILISNFEDVWWLRFWFGYKNFVLKINIFVFILWDRIIEIFYEKWFG